MILERRREQSPRPTSMDFHLFDKSRSPKSEVWYSLLQWVMAIKASWPLNVTVSGFKHIAKATGLRVRSINGNIYPAFFTGREQNSFTLTR